VPGIGTETHVLPVPYNDGISNLGGLVLDHEQWVVIGSTALLCAGLFAVFRYTRVGIAMQASSQNQLAAYYMGIPVQRLNGLVWALAAAVAAIAGILLAPITFVHANMGLIGLKAFPAAVVGGFGSLPGAIVGGLIIGVVESFAGFYLPEGFKDVAAYVVVLVMLVLMPNGLFGEKLRKKV
jgi:branched-chain amino acid transport system permease protein